MITEPPYLIEILTPKRGIEGNIDEHMQRFAQRYDKIIRQGCALSIPDNPLGNLRFSAIETINYLNLAIDPGRVLMNLNTFHTKNDLDNLLLNAEKRGIRYILVVRGDGSPALPKLQPEELKMDVKMVTSIELLAYISRAYAGRFVTGVAFNQFKPVNFEMKKLRRKIAAGAEFIITQPVIGRDRNVDMLIGQGIPVIIEAWMSRNVSLFFKSIKSKPGENLSDYDPFQNLRTLHSAYPEKSVYLSLLDFKIPWEEHLPRLLSK